MKNSILKNILLGIVVATGMFFTSCGRFGSKGTAAKNDSVRIVCASKQITELMFDLGQGDKLVGVDISSTYPEAATKITTIGYHRMLNAEGIISLKPTAFFYNGGADNAVGPDNVIPQLQKVGVTVVQFRSAENIDDTKTLIRDLGRYFNVSAQADSLCRIMDSTMKLAEKKGNNIPIPQG